MEAQGIRGRWMAMIGISGSALGYGGGCKSIKCIHLEEPESRFYACE